MESQIGLKEGVKEGDKVKIIDTFSHGFAMGQEVTFIRMTDNDMAWFEGEINGVMETQWLAPYDYELLKTKDDE